MQALYPNLELLEYKAKVFLSKDEVFTAKLKKVREQNKWIHPDFWATVFIQIWGSTCTGFDIIVHEDGSESATMSGCAMTEEYTTVMFEKNTQTYVVFFGNKLCYIVYDANTKFLDDLRKHQLAGLKEARENY